MSIANASWARTEEEGLVRRSANILDRVVREPVVPSDQ